MRSAVLSRPAQETLCWLALRLTQGLGPRRLRELITRFGSAVAVFRASREELMACGMPGGTAQSISSGCAFEEAAEQQELAQRQGVQVVTLADDRYPTLLGEIYDPPAVLFCQGNVELLESVQVALVGSRRSSAYGNAAAKHLATEMAQAGVCVSSGMARGIDTSAHLGALEAGGTTLAVFGCGLDVIYPAENRKLSERIAAEGLLVSEFPLRAPAVPQNFPVRNRIISGLSVGVVVVEGVQYSGSLITARLAADQNREVFAVPGNITNKLSFGPNLLIKQGAQLVQSGEDILNGLGVETRARLSRQRQLPLGAEQPELPATMAGTAKQILHYLQVDTPVTLDDLVDRMLECSPSELISVLFELELQGRVRQLPGRSYVKVWYE